MLSKIALFQQPFGKTITTSKHYRHSLWKYALLLTAALILSVENGCLISWCLRSKFHVRIEVNTAHDCKSRWHFGRSTAVQGSLSARKEHACLLLSIYHLMVISCNTFGVATSPNVADLFTSFNGMNLSMSSYRSSSFGIAFVGFQEHKTSTCTSIWRFED